MTIDFTPSSLGDSPAPRPRLAAGKKPSLSDAQILEMRALADFEAMAVARAAGQILRLCGADDLLCSEHLY